MHNECLTLIITLSTQVRYLCELKIYYYKIVFHIDRVIYE